MDFFSIHEVAAFRSYKKKGDPLLATRGHAIMVPRGTAAKGMSAMLMAHEIFHVFSRTQPDLRERLYLLIGFEVTPVVSGHWSNAPNPEILKRIRDFFEEF